MRDTSRLGLVGFAVATVLLLGACSSDAGNGNNAGGSPSGTGAIDTDATLRVVSTSPPPTWDPIKATNYLTMTQYYPFVYDRLVRVGADGKTVGSLATDFAVAADGLSATATIRGDVKFWDGTPLTAASVKANFERALDSPDSVLAPTLGPIKAITTTGDTGLTWTFSAPNYAFFNTLALDARLDSVVNPVAFGNAGLNTSPQGSGPYKLVSQKGDTSATFERVGAYGAYWEKGAAEFQRVVATYLTDDNTMLNQLQTDQVDLAVMSQGALANKSVIESAGLQFQAPPIFQNLNLYLNNANPKLNNVQVRQAISLAVDRKALASVGCNSLCTPTTSEFMKGVDGYLPDFESDAATAPDLAKAKQLVAASGVGPFAIQMEYPDVAIFDQIGQVLQQQLKQIGITVQITKAQPVNARADYIAGKYDSALIPITASNDPSIIMNVVANLQNPGKQVPDAVASAVAEAQKTPPGPARVTAWNTANKALVENPIDVPLMTWVGVEVASKKVLNLDKQGTPYVGSAYDARYLALAK